MSSSPLRCDSLRRTAPWIFRRRFLVTRVRLHMGTFVRPDRWGRKLGDRKPLVLLTIVAAFAVSICAFAKDKENSEVKFTARTELVLIPTLVTDKSGVHISGLKKEDF